MDQTQPPVHVEADLDFCPFGAEPIFTPPKRRRLSNEASMGVYTLDPHGYVLGWRPLTEAELRNLWATHTARHGWYAGRGVA